MSNFKTKIKAEEEKEIFYLQDNPRLDEDLPVSVLAAPSKLVAVVKPKKIKSPYVETILLFFCAALSVGADAFIFSTSLFTEIIGRIDTSLSTVVSVLCLAVHIVPEIFWGINIYKKFVRLSNFSVIVADDKLIFAGKNNFTECKTLRLEDLVDIKQTKSAVTLIHTGGKIKLSLVHPDEFVTLVQELYNNL